MIALILFTAAAIQGMTSFGFSMVALPLLSLFLPISQIVPMLVTYSFIINSVLLFSIYKHIRLTIMVPLVGGALLGLPLGIILLTKVDNVILKQFAGALIVLIAILQTVGLRAVVASHAKNFAYVGFLSGVMQGALSLSGPPLVFFLTNQATEKQVFRATLTSYFLVLNIISIPSLVLGRVISLNDFGFILSQVVYVVCGIAAGLFLSSKIQQKLFRYLTLALMCLAGLAALLL